MCFWYEDQGISRLLYNAQRQPFELGLKHKHKHVTMPAHVCSYFANGKREFSIGHVART
jgi:hypothetical protein